MRACMGLVEGKYREQARKSTCRAFYSAPALSLQHSPSLEACRPCMLSELKDGTCSAHLNSSEHVGIDLRHVHCTDVLI